VKLRLPGVADNVAGAIAVPESETSRVVLDPLCVMDRMPLLAPAPVGVKSTPNVMALLGANVSGRFNPVTVKAAALELACVIVRLSLPVFVKVSVWFWPVPT